MYTVFHGNKRIVIAGSDEPFSETRSQLTKACNSKEELKAGFNQLATDQRINSVVFHSADFGMLWASFESMFTVIEAAGGVVLNSKNQLLVIFRNGRWDLPKGKIEEDEPIDAAAIREVEEECGIKDLQCQSQIYSTFHTYELNNKLILKETYWFMMKYNGTEAPKPQEEENIAEAVFVEREQLKLLMQNMHASIKMLLTDVFGKSGHSYII